MSKSFILKIITISFIPFLFLIIGIATLSFYGVNWDEPYHFMRGQAYLHYYISGGEKDFSSLPPYPRINTNCFDGNNLCLTSPGGPTDRKDFDGKYLTYEESIKLLYPKGANVWRSYYQHDIYDFNNIIKSEDGHPAVGDTISAFFNYVFYQKLHILGDIESYHLFEVFTSFLIVLGVAIIVNLEFGVFPSVVASLSLASYPLFFSESHFNIKDPPEASFFGLTIILFYLGITKNKWFYMVASSIVAALAVGTKFNAFFIIPILGLWLLYYLIFFKFRIKDNKLLIISLILYPFITILIFYALWPYLWDNPVNNFINIVSFYKQIGSGTPVEMANYLFRGWNTYPVIWIFFTTPIPILLMSIIGFLVSIYYIFKKKSSFILLVVLWFTIPILRSSYPNSSIYGGVRQLMEFLPAMAILAGIGTYYMLKIIKHKKLIIATISLGFMFTLYEMVVIHPNQNVYFNQMIGGLSGAKKNNIAYWGNSYGNAYKQGVDWLNKNAEPNAKVGLPISTMGNIPWISFRSDIKFSNAVWSGPARLGEYEIELDFDWSPKTWYSYAYYDTFLNPVYEAVVDNVTILKIWKNDLAHTKEEFKKENRYIPQTISMKKNVLGSEMIIDMGREISLTKLVIRHATNNCQNGLLGYIALSIDGKTWQREVDPITSPQVAPSADGTIIGWSKNNFVYLFAAKKARFIILDPQIENSCLLNNIKVNVFGLLNP